MNYFTWFLIGYIMAMVKMIIPLRTVFKKIHCHTSVIYLSVLMIILPDKDRCIYMFAGALTQQLLYIFDPT